MDENTQEYLDSDIEEGTDEPEESSDDSANDAEKKFLDQKRRAEKAEAEAKRLKAELEKQPKVEKKEEEVDDIDRFRLVKDLSDDEYDALSAQAKELGIRPERLAKSDSWKAQLKEMRAKEQKAQKVPEPTTRTVKVGDKTFNEMSDTERQQNWDKIRDAVSGQ